MPPKQPVSRIPRKKSKSPPPSDNDPIVRPERHVPVRRTDRDAEESTDERRGRGSVLEDVSTEDEDTETGNEDDEEEEDEEDEEEDEMVPMAEAASGKRKAKALSPLISSRSNADIRRLEALLEKERNRSTDLSTKLKASNRLLVKEGIAVPGPDDIDALLEQIEDEEMDDIEFVGVGYTGFRNGPYLYLTNPVTPDQILVRVEKAREVQKKQHQHEPWETEHWQKQHDPEAAWREWMGEHLSGDANYAKRNWKILLSQCHVSGDIAETVFIRQFHLTTLNSIAIADDETFKGYLTNIAKSAKVTVPLPSIQCLKAVRCWARWFRLTRGKLPMCADFTFEEAQRAWTRYEFEQNLEKNKPASPTIPEKFKSFKTDVWKVFRDSVRTYVAATRGVLNLPLSYLLRPNLRPATANIYEAHALDTDSGDMDAELMRTVIIDFSTPEIAEDNSRLYSLLLPLVQHTPAWELVRSTTHPNNGRALWTALISRGDGDEEVTLRKNAAQDALKNVTFDDSNRGSMRTRFDQFVRTIQGAYNELEDLGFPVDKATQVRTMVDRLAYNTKIDGYRAHILHTPGVMDNFEKAHNILQSCISQYSDKTKGSTRNVSAVTTDSSGRVPKDQWKAMTPEQRKAHLKKMKSNKSTTTTKGASGTKRKSITDGMSRSQKKAFNHYRSVSSLAQELTTLQNSTTATPVTPPRTSSNPSEQFGSKIQELSAALAKGKNYE
jgi:hypothetical protein